MLSVEDLSKRFGDTPVFDSVSLALKRGEFVALLGESGVGKEVFARTLHERGARILPISDKLGVYARARSAPTRSLPALKRPSGSTRAL